MSIDVIAKEQRSEINMNLCLYAIMIEVEVHSIVCACLSEGRKSSVSPTPFEGIEKRTLCQSHSDIESRTSILTRQTREL